MAAIYPSRALAASSRELPEFGADTQFANLYAAYDALSEGLKASLDSLRAVHSSRHVFGARAGYKGTELDSATSAAASTLQQ